MILGQFVHFVSVPLCGYVFLGYSLDQLVHFERFILRQVLSLPLLSILLLVPNLIGVFFISSPSFFVFICRIIFDYNISTYSPITFFGVFGICSLEECLLFHNVRDCFNFKVTMNVPTTSVPGCVTDVSELFILKQLLNFDVTHTPVCANQEPSVNQYRDTW